MRIDCVVPKRRLATDDLRLKRAMFRGFLAAASAIDGQWVHISAECGDLMVPQARMGSCLESGAVTHSKAVPHWQHSDGHAPVQVEQYVAIRHLETRRIAVELLLASTDGVQGSHR